MERMFYLAEFFNGIDFITTVLGLVLGIGALITFVVCTIQKLEEGENSDEYKTWKITRKYCLIFGIIFSILAILVPSKKTFYLMMSGRVVDQTIDNNPGIKELPEKTIEYLNAWLDKELQDYKKDE